MTGHVAYKRQLLSRLVPCFANLLESSRTDEKKWRKITEVIQRHGLLSSTISAPRARDLPEIDAARLHTDRKYRLSIARKLARPLPPDFQQVVIPLDRAKLSDTQYLEEMSALLASRWMKKLLSQKADKVDRLVLLHVNAESLADSLERLNRSQSAAEHVSHRMMHRFAQEEIDRSKEVQAVFDRLNAAFDETERRASGQFDQIGKRMLGEVDEAFALIRQRTNAKFDALQSKILA